MAVVAPVLDAILHLPTTVHIAVRRTSLRLLGELREWVEKHPEYLGMAGRIQTDIHMFMVILLLDRSGY